MRIPRFLVKKQGDNALWHSPPYPPINGGGNQQGSAIVWILIAIALFAALNFTISQGSRSGTQSITKEQARLAATEILDYGRAIKQAVQTLQINGCSDTEVSFENPVVPGYEHTPPARDECKVFHPAGGGLNYLEPEEEWMDGLATSQAAGHYGTWFTNSRVHIRGLGIDNNGSVCSSGTGDCKELTTGVPFIKKEICIEINKKIGWGVDDNGTPYQDTGASYGTGTLFTGSYPSGGVQMGTASPSNYSNIMTGCIEGDVAPPSGTYSFFQVLIVR